jgi:hypothetical protein
MINQCSSIPKAVVFFVLLSNIILNFYCYADENDHNINSSVERALLFLSDSDTLYINDIAQMSAFFTILEDCNASKYFYDLLQKSKTGCGKFYALLGLFETDVNYYQKILRTVDLSEEIVVKVFRTADFNQLSTIGELQIAIENLGWIENMNNVRKKYKE